MAHFLDKVYGPDWEETIGLNDASPIGTLFHNPLHNHNPLPTTPAEKFGVQLAQVQLLVQGMERRLVSREAELEALHLQAKEESNGLQDKLDKLKVNKNIFGS